MKYKYGMGALALLTATIIAIPSYAINTYEYAIFRVPGLGDFSSQTWGVNVHGIVIGDSFPQDTGNFHAYISDMRRIYDLGTFGGQDSMTWGLNDSGTVVGWSENSLHDRRAFVWTRKNGMIDLGAFGGDGSIAFDVNNHGQVVGLAEFPGNSTGDAFLWEGGELIGLGALDNSMVSEAFGINELGVIVGESMNAQGIYRPVMWKDGQIIDLGSLGDGTNRGNANGINDLEQVVGQSWDDSETNHPFLWQNGQMTQLSNKAGFARDINNLGQAVGAVFVGSEGMGFVWEQSKGLRILDNLIAPNSGIQISDATGITDNGLISVNAPDPNSCQICNRAFLLVHSVPQITLGRPEPGIAGEVNTLTVTGAKPGSFITFAYSLKGGGALVPGCDATAAVLMLDKPRVIRSVQADGNGVAVLEMFVPQQAANMGKFLFQAVRVEGCAESNLVTWFFQ